MNGIARAADFLGALLFLILFIYFYNIKDKGYIELGLMVITGISFLIDTVFIVSYILYGG